MQSSAFIALFFDKDCRAERSAVRMANTMAMDPRLSQCGIAKLLGSRGDEVLEYFMRKYAIVLGRNSKNCQVDLVLGVYTTRLLLVNSTTGSVPELMR